MKLDMLATEPQFADHLAAVWHAIPADVRGDFLVPASLRDRARARGIPGPGATVEDHGRPILVAAYGDQKRARGMGRTAIAYIEHGAGQAYPGDRRHPDHASYAGGRDRADCSLFLVPNEYSAELWRQAYPTAAVRVVGCPKLDSLPRLEGPAGVVCISFHWSAESAIQETRGTFTHYRSVLDGLALRFPLIGHGHPRALDNPPRLRREYRRRDIQLVEDFDEVCRRASVYVCDNSSTLFEFAATGRPVVVLNEPVGRIPERGYRRDVHHGLRFWDAAGVGVNVWQPEDLAAAIDLALADPPELQAGREAALDIVYARRTGAAAAAAAALLEWLADDTRARAAA